MSFFFFFLSNLREISFSTSRGARRQHPDSRESMEGFSIIGANTSLPLPVHSPPSYISRTMYLQRLYNMNVRVKAQFIYGACEFLFLTYNRVSYEKLPMNLVNVSLFYLIVTEQQLFNDLINKILNCKYVKLQLNN